MSLQQLWTFEALKNEWSDIFGTSPRVHPIFYCPSESISKSLTFIILLILLREVFNPLFVKRFCNSTNYTMTLLPVSSKLCLFLKQRIKYHYIYKVKAFAFIKYYGIHCKQLLRTWFALQRIYLKLYFQLEIRLILHFKILINRLIINV